MHANSHDPRSSPAYVGPQFAPAIAVDDETVAIVGASTRAAFRATHGATTTAAAAAATTSATAAARQPRRRPLQATGPITNGTSSSPSARVNAANPASAPAAPHSHAIACPSRVQRQQHRPERERDEDRLGHHRTVRRDQDRADRGERGGHESDPCPGDPAPDQPGERDRRAPGRDAGELRSAYRVARDRLHEGEERRIERWPRRGRGALGREDRRIGERVLVPDDAALEVVPARVDSESQPVQHDDVVQQPQDRAGEDDDTRVAGRSHAHVSSDRPRLRIIRWTPMTGRRWFAPEAARPARRGRGDARRDPAVRRRDRGARRSPRRPGRRLRADGSARPRRLVVRHPARRRIQPVRVEPSGTGGLLRDRAGVRTVREAGVGDGRRQRARARTDRRRDRARCLANRVASRASCLTGVRRARVRRDRTVDGARTLGTRTSRTRCSCCSCCSPGCSRPVIRVRSSAIALVGSVARPGPHRLPATRRRGSVAALAFCLAPRARRWSRWRTPVSWSALGLVVLWLPPVINEFVHPSNFRASRDSLTDVRRAIARNAVGGAHPRRGVPVAAALARWPPSSRRLRQHRRRRVAVVADASPRCCCSPPRVATCFRRRGDRSSCSR